MPPATSTLAAAKACDRGGIRGGRGTHRGRRDVNCFSATVPRAQNRGAARDRALVVESGRHAGRERAAVLMRSFLLAFIPLFVAVDVVGLVPIYLGISSGIEDPERRQLVLEATLTAAAVGTGFLVMGDAILSFLGVSVGDFQVAGGTLLLVLAVYDLLHPELPLRRPGARLGGVPLGIPMIVGPAVLTTLLTVARTQGYAITLVAFALNLALAWAALQWAALLGRLVGDAGARAVAKVSSLLLAAIGVTFIRRGIAAAIATLS